jgi:hypothetical protein
MMLSSLQIISRTMFSANSDEIVDVVEWASSSIRRLSDRVYSTCLVSQ